MITEDVDIDDIYEKDGELYRIIGLWTDCTVVHIENIKTKKDIISGIGGASLNDFVKVKENKDD